MSKKIERRFVRGSDTLVMRAAMDGAKRISGVGSSYDTSYDVGGWFTEKFRAGAFSESLKSSDARCFFNHDPSYPLGRQKSGTLTLEETRSGLMYSCIPPANAIAEMVVEAIERGDVDGSSIGFQVIEDTWADECDDKGRVISTTREVIKANLVDVGPVTFPANPDTTSLVRMMWPMGASPEIRSIVRAVAQPDAEDPCECDCPACYDGDCHECDCETCNDTRCEMDGCPMQAEDRGEHRGDAKTKRVDGEDLSRGDFIIQGEEDDPKTWKLPYKFSTDEKTKSHLVNALARFNQLKGISDEEKAAAWKKLVSLCKDHGIKVEGEDMKKVRARLTDAQSAEFYFDAAAHEAAAAIEVRKRHAAVLLLQTTL